MKNKTQKNRWMIVAVLFLMLAGAVFISWFFSSEPGQASNAISHRVAGFVEKVIAEHFPVNRKDFFWSGTLNLIVRKCAHFLEYIFIGVAVGALFHVMLQRSWIAIPLSAAVCTGLAIADEYHQKFVSGRSARWFDVKIDIGGALLGIAFVTVVILLYRHIRKQKERIRELEWKYGNLSKGEDK